MPDAISFEVSGLEEANRALDDLAPNLRRRVLRKALKAGGDVFAEEVSARAPVKTADTAPSSDSLPDGALKADIHVDISTSNRDIAGTAHIGPSSKTSRAANWVEFGHRQVSHEPGKKEVGHVPAQPFIRPAFDAAHERAADAFTETMISGIEEVGRLNDAANQAVGIINTSGLLAEFGSDA